MKGKDETFLEKAKEITAQVSFQAVKQFGVKPQDQEDLAQEMLLNIFASKHRYDEKKGSLAAFLRRICCNVRYDFTKKGKREHMATSEYLDDLQAKRQDATRLNTIIDLKAHMRGCRKAAWAQLLSMYEEATIRAAAGVTEKVFLRWISRFSFAFAGDGLTDYVNHQADRMPAEPAPARRLDEEREITALSRAFVHLIDMDEDKELKDAWAALAKRLGKKAGKKQELRAARHNLEQILVVFEQANMSQLAI